MRQRIALVVLPASILAAADLSVKVVVPTDERYLHPRSPAWTAASLGLLAGALLLARLPSRGVALAAGLLFGGVAGNLVSARWSDGGVPNPLVVRGDGFVIAFNVADVVTLAGIGLLTVMLCVLSIRHRERLPESTVAARVARRLAARRQRA